MPTEPMLSVEEVLELQPGAERNPTWINPGFTAVVLSIETKRTKAGTNFWPCVLGSQTGSASIEVSFFTVPKFQLGDLIELSGNGLRRTDYNGKAQASLGKATEVHVLGKSAHHEDQKERRAASEPAVSGEVFPVPGQTVGMAMKEALALAGMAAGGVTAEILADPKWWESVKRYAGNIIRLSRSLEAGKLSPASWAKPSAPPAVKRDHSPPPQPQQQQYDEDVPF